MLRLVVVLALGLLATVAAETTFFEFDEDDPYEPFPFNNDSPFFHFIGPDGTVFSDGTHKIQGEALIIKASPMELTMPQGPLGVLDHVKSLQYAIDTAPFVNFPVPPTGVFRYSATFSGKSTRTALEPFGSDFVTDPRDDIRLAR